MPAGGGTSQTAVNRLTGARTQVAGIVTAVMTVVTMLLLAPLIALMPQATLAAVVIVYSVGLMRPPSSATSCEFARRSSCGRSRRSRASCCSARCKGILVAIVVSLVALAQQTANPPVYVLGRKRGTNVFRPRVRGARDGRDSSRACCCCGWKDGCSS